MYHTDLGQPDLAALRAAAGDAEFAEAEARLVSACGYPLADTGPLRRWIAHHDPHVSAAVELLIEHEAWIRRADFQRACIEKNAREAWINWRKAREFVDSGSVASTSEMAVLDLAVALGENRFKFSIMGPANSRMIAQAVARALGEDR